MGARCAPSVAQFATWAVVRPLTQIPGVTVFTCIDNVRIIVHQHHGGDHATTFVSAVRLFLNRCREANIELNAHGFDGDEQSIIDAGAKAASGSRFLGEFLSDKGTKNCDHTVDKLRRWWLLFQSGIKLTRRQLVSGLSLIFFLAHTLNIQLYSLHSLVRVYAAMSAVSTPWDEPGFMTPRVLPLLTQVVDELLVNRMVVPLRVFAPLESLNDYDAVIVVDACLRGFGAWIRVGDRAVSISSGWGAAIPASAHAEPLAAARALVHLGTMVPRVEALSVALVTDHQAMVSGQRRWWNGFGGFSPNPFLNNFFALLYGGTTRQRDVFFVEGEINPTDGLSRSVRIGDRLSVAVLQDVQFPEALEHPYRHAPARPDYQV